MPTAFITPGSRVLVTGAGGQDARFLIPSLQSAGADIHAVIRRRSRADSAAYLEPLNLYEFDLAANPQDIANALVTAIRPDYVLNLAGQSSVRASFDDPGASWQVNAAWVLALLEAIRVHSPATRMYQSSSSEMFGSVAGGTVTHDESSPLHPQSPYAASKAAAHLLCTMYRSAFGIRVACGILFNHESKYRGTGFLTSKIAEHVRRLRSEGPSILPLAVGNLSIRRDWGHAADFSDGILRILLQAPLRRVEDVASNYNDYVLGTGVLTTVQTLVDRAFAAGGFELRWDQEDPNPASWKAYFGHSNRVAVLSDPALFRRAEPAAIQSDSSRALRDLGWRATATIDTFLREMVVDGGP